MIHRASDFSDNEVKKENLTPIEEEAQSSMENWSSLNKQNNDSDYGSLLLAKLGDNECELTMQITVKSLMQFCRACEKVLLTLKRDQRRPRKRKL